MLPINPVPSTTGAPVPPPSDSGAAPRILDWPAVQRVDKQVEFRGGCGGGAQSPKKKLK